ncbi:Hypothetical predicted protein [Marmota monax]|uniref:Uncharacterized protein n=1 Tax=Marmota monax TaxID=9995 RepID=A0A5E4BYJ3_MARMO|nr:Hypothetical predicted protein [Marmota monax]
MTKTDRRGRKVRSPSWSRGHAFAVAKDSGLGREHWAESRAPREFQVPPESPCESRREAGGPRVSPEQGRVPLPPGDSHQGFARTPLTGSRHLGSDPGPQPPEPPDLPAHRSGFPVTAAWEASCPWAPPLPLVPASGPTPLRSHRPEGPRTLPPAGESRDPAQLRNVNPGRTPIPRKGLRDPGTPGVGVRESRPVQPGGANGQGRVRRRPRPPAHPRSGPPPQSPGRPGSNQL